MLDLERFGVLREMPQPQSSEELLSSVRRKLTSKRIPIKKWVRNKRAAKSKPRMDSVSSVCKARLQLASATIEKGINLCTERLPALDNMHPLERAMVRLTLEGGEEQYRGAAEALRKVVRRANDAERMGVARISKAKNTAGVTEAHNAALEQIERDLEPGGLGAKALQDVASIVKLLYKVETLDPFQPCCAMVGAPNVGKSSIIRKLSKAEPAVHMYPFTTRALLVGHMELPGRMKHTGKWLQVADTPGLLPREDHHRKPVELLTIALLEHLRTSFPPMIVFVVDPTEHCGFSIQQQMLLRHEIKERFPSHPWLDVLSKHDVAHNEDADNLYSCTEAKAMQAYATLAWEAPAGWTAAEGGDLTTALWISPETGHNMDLFKRILMDHGELRADDVKKPFVIDEDAPRMPPSPSVMGFNPAAFN